MKRCVKLYPLIALALALAFMATVSVTKVSHAQPGPAPAESAIAEYDSLTGRIVVSYTNVSNWFVDSLSGMEVMTGPDDVGDVLPLNGGFVSNSSIRVGETVFGGNFSDTNIDLGEIAASGLDQSTFDLIITWNGPGFGGDRGFQPVVCLGCDVIDEPADLNQDGFVDGLDLGIQLGNWGDDVTASQGELNGVVPVDGLDLGILLGAWAPPSVASVATVPEPSSIALLALSSLSLLVARRNRS
ncbi:MAG: PEP-CTERM sorting domain-containing protein [Pirellulales bacterium]